MTKVSELIGDCYLPEGMSREVALRIAGEMRQILNRDLDEIDVSLEVTLYEDHIDSENKLAAWGYLNASERRTWKAFLKLFEDSVRDEKLNAHH